MGKQTLGDLEARLGHRFSDRSLLEKALTHRSYAFEANGKAGGDYERLEFLGDALLGFIVSDWLSAEDPDASEGVLTRRKQMVVRSQTLAQVAKTLGLGEAMRLSKGERSTGGGKKPSLLADVFEATLAAVYRDGGIRSARAYVRRHLKPYVVSAQEGDRPSEDYKSRLQEAVQADRHVTPRYRIVSTSGPDHARTFKVEVVVAGDVLGSGRGSSRKRAEQAAARKALTRVLDEESTS